MDYCEMLELTDFGYKDSADIHGIPPSIRNCNIIHYCISGKGTFTLNGKTYNIKKGQSFFIPEGEVASYYPDLSDPWEYCWVDFKANGKTVLNTTAFTNKTPVTPTINEIKPFFDIILNSDRDLGKDYFDGLLKSLICLYAKFYKSKEKSPENEILFKAKQYIFSNYHKCNLTVSDIAKSCAVSRATLFRIFKNSLNLSPQQYINKVRLEVAGELLIKTDCKIKIISVSAGYENQLYFSKFFKAKYGLSPSQFRNKNKRSM